MYVRAPAAGGTSLSHPQEPIYPPSRKAPSIWALTAEKLGDNAQVEAVVNALGLPWSERRLVMRPEWRTAKPAISADLGHIDPIASAALAPPWPDLIVTSGRRLFNVALWIKQHSPRTRLVLVGRPHKHFNDCDLIIAAPQFRLPALDNVINVSLPLLFPPRDRIAAEADEWRAELADMKRPLTAVLVGAGTQPFRFGSREARQLIRQATKANAGAGSLFVTTSRRTPQAVADAIEASLSPADRLFRWQPDSARNPYLALLGLADRFVVTGDSASMLVEVARLNRPLAIYELPPDPRPAYWPRHVKYGIESAARRLGGDVRAEGLLRPLGLGRKRDLTALHRTLYRIRRAVRLGVAYPPPAAEGLDDEMAQIVSRIRKLLEPR